MSAFRQPRPAVRLSLAISTITFLAASTLTAQGVTTAAMNGVITDQTGRPLEDATVSATHVESGTQYRAYTRPGGVYNLPNMRVGGPYTVTVTMIGYEPRTQENIFLALGQSQRIDFQLLSRATTLAGVQVTAEQDPVLNAGRSGAATTIDAEQVALLPSVKRSTRDLTRTDPRSDGNMSFGGRNWLYNNITVDGSYFNNPFGLDDPAPGGQANAEPLPFDAVEQVRVSVAPFDVRQGGFTGANINTVTKSGTNQFQGTVYSFLRNDAFQGNKVRGAEVIANPDLSYNQSGFSISGPIVRNRAFFFINAELERTDDPGTNFVAGTGTPGFGVSRVDSTIMDSIRARMIQEYNYDPGAWQGYVHETNNNKLLAKLDWNIGDANNLSVRYSWLDAKRDLGPHPFVLSYGGTGRGPNQSSLPFEKSGYAINNELHSIAAELNTSTRRFANRFFASYNRFRDNRDPFSEDFPTIDIGEGTVSYTTLGHEPFSIHNILDQDVLQLTDNFTVFRGRHSFTLGANYEAFSFFNSFNIFRHGVFFLPQETGIGSQFDSLDEFFTATDPANPNQIDFRALIGSGPYKGENIDVGQFSVYAQDEYLWTDRLTVTYGVRLDVPTYFTDPIENPFSTGLTALDENDNPETIDQADLAGGKILWSPRVGFNWNARGERETQLRGGTGIFTGRIPFVWVGNVISNPGFNPNLYPAGPVRPTKYGSTLAQSFDLNAMDPDFRYPQVWTTDIAIDQQLPWNTLGTLELIYSKDLNAVYMRNADLVTPVRTLPDGRPYFGGAGNNELNADFGPGAPGPGIYVIDNTDQGYSFNLTTQLRKEFSPSFRGSVAYNFLVAKNVLKSTEIASVLWQEQPVQGDPNRPELSYSEFGQPHRFIAHGTYTRQWSAGNRTQFGIFGELARGNRFAGAGGNRYSFVYSGDVNGDGYSNDLIYIPRDQSDIILLDYTPPGGSLITAAEQWTRLNAFIEQDEYLSEHRGEIAERFGAINPWYSTVDLRILHDFSMPMMGRRHSLQLSLDILNVLNLVNSDWGVRKVASSSATTPLRFVDFDGAGAPRFNFTGPSATYIDDPNLLSRWRAQFGLRYLFGS